MGLDPYTSSKIKTRKGKQKKCAEEKENWDGKNRWYTSRGKRRERRRRRKRELNTRQQYSCVLLLSRERKRRAEELEEKKGRTVTIRDLIIYVYVCVEFWVSRSGGVLCRGDDDEERSIDCEENLIRFNTGREADGAGPRGSSILSRIVSLEEGRCWRCSLFFFSNS